MVHASETFSEAMAEGMARSLPGSADGLFEIAQALLGPAEGSLEEVARILQSRFGLRHVLLNLREPDRSNRVLVMAPEERLPPEVYARGAGRSVVERIERTRRSVPFDGESENRLCEVCDPAHERPLCRYVGVPVMRREELVGTLTAERSQGHEDLEAVGPVLDLLSKVGSLVGRSWHFQEVVARDRERLMEERRRAEKAQVAVPEAAVSDSVPGIVGRSPALQSVLRKVQVVAKSHLPVLLRGESGTGKELFARAIHDLSPRREGPMVRLNCAALSETMLESELFGHERGAFTGAVNQRKGRFEMADGGTLFLDEIGEISASFQAKLLRVLQEGEFERVGGSDTIRVDVRLVAATNRDLEEDVRNGTFRSDLYFRLCVVPVVLMPLRERAEDIPLLAEEFLRRFNAMHGSNLTFGADALDLMQGCSFPGNIRELESCVRRTAALCDGPVIHAGHYACRNDSCLSMLLSRPRQPPASTSQGFHPLPVRPAPAVAEVEAVHDDPSGYGPDDSAFDGMAEMGGRIPDRRRVVDAMERAGWVQAKAARLLGLTPRQICYALRKHGIEVKKF